MTEGVTLCTGVLLAMLALSGCASDLENGKPPDGGLGVISGSCDVLDAGEWQSTDSFFFQNAIDFGKVGFDTQLLTPGGSVILDAGNLGGSSLHSEVIAFEMLARCEEAELIKTEAEIAYQDPAGKKTDLLVNIDEQVVGVSVTRAFHYPPIEPCTAEEIHNLLEDKLADAQISQANAAEENAWSRSILTVIAHDPDCAQQIQNAYHEMEPTVLADTIVWTTITNGNDDFLY